MSAMSLSTADELKEKYIQRVQNDYSFEKYLEDNP